MKHLVAVAVLIFGLMAGTLGNAGVAAAHAARIASDPVEDASVSKSPSRVSATFNEAMQSQFAAMTVVGPDGDLWSTGEPEVNGAIISVGVRPLGPSGTYTVNYRATSADGHVVSGSWSFQLTVAGTGTPGPPVAEASGPPAADASGNSEATGGIPVWPFFVGAVVIIGAGAWWAARRRK
jgi:copper resistance protein C